MFCVASLSVTGAAEGWVSCLQLNFIESSQLVKKNSMTAMSSEAFRKAHLLPLGFLALKGRQKKDVTAVVLL